MCTIYYAINFVENKIERINVFVLLGKRGLTVSVFVEKMYMQYI